MRSRPLFFEQERNNTCALACLRMVLAHNGITVTENELVGGTAIEQEGVAFEEVVRLARRYHLSADIQRLDLDGITKLLDQKGLAIVFVDRGVINGVSAIHAVIPIRVSQRYVTFLDPLQGERRVARKRFDAAWGNLKHLCIVCRAG
jgi:ABC-type bacteriocin/lantibiotic exporter with double-glycine peptidase domain